MSTADTLCNFRPGADGFCSQCRRPRWDAIHTPRLADAPEGAKA